MCFGQCFQGSDPIIEPRTEQTLKYWKEGRKKGRKEGKKEGGKNWNPGVLPQPEDFFL